MFKKLFTLSVLLVCLISAFYYGLNEYYSKEKTIQVQKLTRKYRVHLPKDYSQDKNYPLLIALHDSTGNPRFFEINTGFSLKADKRGFIVVYPYGTGAKRFSTLTWNADFCCGFAKETNVNDTLFISSLLTQLKDDYSIDDSKVYLVGFSNGAMLVNKLAKHISDKISGFAVVSGSNGATNTETEESIYLTSQEVGKPAIIFHGKNDSSVPFDGGGVDPEFNFAGVYDEVNFWLANNKCTIHPNQIVNKTTYVLEDYTSCDSPGNVQFYALESGKHNWPGGFLDFKKYISKDNIEASELILDFFKL